VEITPAGRKHGVSDEDIAHAIANAIRLIEHDDGLLFIGPDHAADLLEVLARQGTEGLVVFHAMPLRPSYRERYLP
jgi:hypothetical protein